MLKFCAVNLCLAKPHRRHRASPRWAGTWALQRDLFLGTQLIAPAVHAAIGQRVGLAGEVADPDAEDKSPYEACLEVCIANLERDHEIYRPDFLRADAHVARVWAGSVSEKLTRSAKVELDNIFYR